MGHIGHMGLSPMGQRGTLAVFNWELGTPVSVANETLNRGFPPHAVLHMLRTSVPSACLGKNLRSKVFHCAKLRDGTRDSVLALKPRWQYFTHFADALAFRGRSPSVTKSSTHPSVSSVKIHTGSPARSATQNPELRPQNSSEQSERNSELAAMPLIHHFSKDSYCSFFESVK